VTRTLSPTRTLLLLILLGALSAGTAQTAGPAAPVKPALARKPKPHRGFQPPYNPNVIILDPAHGGSDDGAHLGSDLFEKDFDVAFAERVKSLLEAEQFTVVLTHSSADDTVSPDQRVELANRSRGVACLLIHATTAGRGIHLFTSALTAPALADAALADTYVAPWDSAQTNSLNRSLQLANELSTALNGLRVPLIVGRASVAPIDSMSCAAVAVEIAPANAGSGVSDDPYQQQIAQSLVTALTYWRRQAQAQIAASQAAAEAANPAPAAVAPAPRPKPKPKPVVVPEETPLVPDSTAPKPAPIERKPPPAPDAGTPPPSGAQP
jgi:N-acetylmuramoyl-L-alanine amidase